MRRNGTRIGILAVVLLGIVVIGFVAYGRGKTAGQTTASSDRSAFGQSRGTSVAGGQGVGAGGSGQGAGGGGQRSGGASGQSGTGAASPVAGKVTKVDSGTITLQQQPSNTTTTVATNATTTVTTFAPGALSGLMMGDVIAVQGDKTGDTAYTAKTIYALSGSPGRGASGRAPSGTDTAAGTAPAGPSASGGQNRGAGSTSGSAPAGGAAGGSALLPGLTGPTGRIAKIDSGTLTLQAADGSMTTVTTNASTSLRKETPGMVSDIKVGDTVSVQSDPSGDASAPARAIIDLGAGT